MKFRAQLGDLILSILAIAGGLAILVSIGGVWIIAELQGAARHFIFPGYGVLHLNHHIPGKRGDQYLRLWKKSPAGGQQPSHQRALLLGTPCVFSMSSHSAMVRALVKREISSVSSALCWRYAPAPTLGQHTVQVLQEYIGMPAEEISALLAGQC